MWAAEVAETGGESKRIDALTWLSRATLDIIGQAGKSLHCHTSKGITYERTVSIHLLVRFQLLL